MATPETEVPDSVRELLTLAESQLSAFTSLARLVKAHGEQIDKLWDQIAELRDELHAIANRLESTNRVLASRTDHLV